MGALGDKEKKAAARAHALAADRAAKIALHEAITFLSDSPEFEKVIFCCFGPAALRVYEEILDELTDIPHL